MTSDGTTRRGFRCRDEVWDPAAAVAAKRGETLTDVLVRALVDYTARDAELTASTGQEGFALISPAANSGEWHLHTTDATTLQHTHPRGHDPHGYYEHHADGAHRLCDHEPEATS